MILKPLACILFVTGVLFTTGFGIGLTACSEFAENEANDAMTGVSDTGKTQTDSREDGADLISQTADTDDSQNTDAWEETADTGLNTADTDSQSDIPLTEDSDSELETISHTDTNSSTGDAINQNNSTDSAPPDTDTDEGVCVNLCNAITAEDPVLGENVSSGSVTTYGAPSNPENSVGGACNYGQTALKKYAAIHVHVSASDNDFLGPWDDGHACGGCMKVRTRTAEGWLETTVRITDRCADEFCGVDLGGAPAADVMPLGPGRYQGEWEWISCEGHEALFDGPTALCVKDGANSYWSLIQIRNPLSRVTGLSVRKDGAAVFEPLDWAIEAENFYTVPADILKDDSTYTLLVEYDLADAQVIQLRGTDLAMADACYDNLTAGEATVVE